MPDIFSRVTRYAVETGRFRSDRPSYVCPLCDDHGCIDAFPQTPVVINNTARIDLHASCGADLTLVIPMTGFDAPYIEARGG